jgi:hypothetical protein
VDGFDLCQAARSAKPLVSPDARHSSGNDADQCD